MSRPKIKDLACALYLLIFLVLPFTCVPTYLMVLKRCLHHCALLDYNPHNAFEGIIVQLCLNLDYAFHRQAINVPDLINVVLISDFS